MRRFFRALLPSLLLLILGLLVLGALLQCPWSLDLRWPFGLWLVLLPLVGGFSLGHAYGERWLRAWLLSAGAGLAALLALVLPLNLLNGLGLLLLGGGWTLLQFFGAWLGAGIALARRRN